MAAEDRQVPIAIAASPLKDSVVYIEVDSLNMLVPGYQGISETPPEAGTEEVAYRNGTVSFAGDDTTGTLEVSMIHMPGTRITNYLQAAARENTRVQLHFRSKGKLLKAFPDAYTLEAAAPSSGYAELTLKTALTGGNTVNWAVGDNVYEGAVFYKTGSFDAATSIVIVDQVTRNWDDTLSKDPFIDPDANPYTANAEKAYTKSDASGAVAATAGWNLFTPFVNWSIAGDALAYIPDRSGASPIATFRMEGPDSWPSEEIIHHNNFYLPKAVA